MKKHPYTLPDQSNTIYKCKQREDGVYCFNSICQSTNGCFSKEIKHKVRHLYANFKEVALVHCI